MPGSFDIEFIQFMEFIKLKNFLCLEFATYPLHLELENNIQDSEKLFSSKSSLIPHLLISPSRINDINGRQYFFLKHGYTAEPPKSFKEPSSEIKMLAVANISKWHGFDRLIKGLNSYVILNSESKISLQIIGDGIFKNDLRNLVKDLNIDNFVKFIDYKTHEELVDYYLDSSIAISTLNLNRINMSYAQPLKQANYLLHGLPIVSCLKTENEKIDMFSCIVPNDETTLDLKKVISFYKKVKRKFSKLDISKTAIRELSWNNFAQSFDIEIKKFFR